MKKSLVLIVLLFLTGSFTLLAQINKTDTTASKKDAVKPAVSSTNTDTTTSSKAKTTDQTAKLAAQKKQADSIANVQTAKLAAQKKQADSLSNIQAAKLSTQKKQTDSIANVQAAKLSTQKKQTDSLSSAKTPKLTDQNIKKDSVASLKQPTVTDQNNKKDTVLSNKTAPQLTDKVKQDTTSAKKDIAKVATVTNKTDTTLSAKKDTSKLSTVANKIDTTLSAKKDISKIDNKKTKKALSDSLSTKTKSKIKAPKEKSAKELKREAQKNNVDNLSQSALAKMAFEHLSADSSIRNPGSTRHIDISYTNAKPFNLSEPNINNMKFYHRYWRDIELQDPKNKQFSAYHAALINALLDAIKTKRIKAYSPVAALPDNPTGDAFTVPIAYDQLMSGLSDTSVVNVIDKDGNITGTKTIPNPFTPDKIAGYRIKEDVYYDKIRSRSVTLIIGIAPLVKLTLSTGEVLNVQPLCWLRFKDCRKILVTIDIDPTKKIGDSMDDIFLQRRFYSKIVQESTPEGKRIKDYKPELPDQEVEARRIEKKIVEFKKGSWNYTMLHESPVQAVDSVKHVSKLKKTTVKQAIPKQ